MRLIISSPHLPLPPALQEYIDRRAQTLPRHFDRDSFELHVALESPSGAGKRRFVRCVARLRVPGTVLVVHKRGQDAFRAVDAAVDALQRSLDDYHQRVLIGSRFPKKYFVARQVAEEALPVLVSEGEAVFAQEEERSAVPEAPAGEMPASEAPEPRSS
jgi:ribosomal subunit interface protein